MEASISLKPRSEELMAMLGNTDAIIDAVETEDTLGTILRFHLYLEMMLSLYLSEMMSDGEAEFIGKIQNFAQKMNYAVAYKLPLSFAAVFNKVNKIRNKAAHQLSHSLELKDIQELGKLVNALASLNPNMQPLEKQYISVTKLGNDHRAVYGDDIRFDFIMCCMTLYREVFPYFLRKFAALRRVPID